MKRCTEGSVIVRVTAVSEFNQALEAPWRFLTPQSRQRINDNLADPTSSAAELIAMQRYQGIGEVTMDDCGIPFGMMTEMTDVRSIRGKRLAAVKEAQCDMSSRRLSRTRFR
jgi:hypothetical protein